MPPTGLVIFFDSPIDDFREISSGASLHIIILSDTDTMTTGSTS